MEARNNIRYYRKRAGLTQQQLAKKAGVSPTTVSHLEQTGSQPNEKTKELLAEILKVPSEELCGYDSPFTACCVSLPKADGDYLCAYKVHPRAKYETQVLHWSTALKEWSTNFSYAPVGRNAVKFWMDIPEIPYII